MRSWLRSLFIFGAMVAAPFALDRLAHRRGGPSFAVDSTAIANAASLAAAALIVVGIVLLVLFHEKLKAIATCLTLAERDLNNLLNSGLEHGGRKSRAIERSEWNVMSVSPTTQIFEKGYRTPSHDLIAENEKELQGKGAAMGKAGITAFLLRELYEGNVETAQSKIAADTKNSDKVPYIAPGIGELIGFDKFDPKTGFPPGTGVNWVLLKMTVTLWRFPRDILMVKTASTGVRTALRNSEVLADLTVQSL